jgi:hypothetical protein
MQDLLAGQIDMFFGTPDHALVKGDAEKWWPIIKELGIRAE